MAARIYDYVDANHGNIIEAWLRMLPKKLRAKVNSKIQALMQVGDEVLPGFVTSAVGSGHIKEIVINGAIAIRLLLCRGPVDIGRNIIRDGSRQSPYAAPEFTLLFGAEERDNRYVPDNAVHIAESFREIILKDQTRRTEHVHVGS